ncbi:UNVERIFIED_CONTAM: hypothetical protein Sangu_2782200 [Sesamum angustifolium]|uniref:Uncharacterized protein n=1 Tax=Sesamum angustifolium TaxID=2727405 RepID=A0AAW2IT59_9LAMI
MMILVDGDHNQTDSALGRLQKEFNFEELLSLANRVNDDGDIDSMAALTDFQARWFAKFERMEIVRLSDRQMVSVLSIEAALLPLFSYAGTSLHRLLPYSIRSQLSAHPREGYFGRRMNTYGDIYLNACSLVKISANPSAPTVSMDALPTGIFIRKIKLRYLPVEFWVDEGLSTVVSGIGKPLYQDTITKVCTRLDFAHVCIMLKISSKLLKHVIIMVPNENGNEVSCKVDVEYEWVPPKCAKFMCLGHLTVSCQPQKTPLKPLVAVYVQKIWVPTTPMPKSTAQRLWRSHDQ